MRITTDDDVYPDKDSLFNGWVYENDVQTKKQEY
jgi:hypothetical protein